MVTPKLNEPLEVSATVPSDSSYVNRTHTDGFPLLAEGVRQLYCFRRESDTSPFYTIRASTLIMQINDASGTGDARSRLTAWDPWQYLFSRPVLQSHLATIGKNGSAGTDEKLIPSENLFYPTSVSADSIIQDILLVTTGAADVTAPAAARDCFLDLANGTVETCSAPSAEPWEIQQGTSVGQALQDIVASGVCDIVLSPIYDPARPGILCELNVYTQTAPANGAGDFKYSAVFAWDRPGRSMVAVDNLYDGVGRANYVQYYNGQGGPNVNPYSDAVSIASYGEYWAQQFFPAQTVKEAVEAIARQQLSLRKSFKETLTVNPVPERSPEPFVDYYLGDRVPVYVSNNMRQNLPSVWVYTTANGVNALNSATVNVVSTAGFPASGSFILKGTTTAYTGKTATSFTGCGSHPATVGSEAVVLSTSFAWQRIYGIPVEIDDNSVETVRELLVGPTGGPPPVAGRGTGAPAIFKEVSVSTARQTNRAGSVNRP